MGYDVMHFHLGQVTPQVTDVMGDHDRLIVSSCPLKSLSADYNTDWFKIIEEGNTNEFYYPDENENINSHVRRILKKRRFVIESDDED